MPLDQLFRILSASLAPVVLISGVGLLLLSMTNRFGRVIDRARQIAHEIEAGVEDPRRSMLEEQLDILYRRGRILRGSILFTSSTVLCVSLGVLCVFATQLAGFHTDYLSPSLFALALVSVAPGVFLFIQDIVVSLRALELEIRPRR
jgi:hypothetical protein